MTLTDTEREVKLKQLNRLYGDINSLDMPHLAMWAEDRGALKLEARQLESELGIPHKVKAPWERE
jgi:hypothetical protein